MRELPENLGQSPAGQRCTTYEGTSDVTSWGGGSSNTGDTHNEPFRASVWPVPDNLYVVVGYGPRHNFPMEWVNQGLPPGLLSSEVFNEV